MTQNASPLLAALTQRCPNCGKGKLFSGLLAVTEQCSVCQTPLNAYEKGDGPAFFAITLVGFVVTGLATWLELTQTPPYWLHAILWPPLISVLSIFFLRFFKALIIAVQYRHGLLDGDER